jgi:hypothetical protein
MTLKCTSGIAEDMRRALNLGSRQNTFLNTLICLPHSGLRLISIAGVANGLSFQGESSTRFLEV